MKKSLLDDLARTVATPMPRRQALRAIGATLAMGAFRMLRPGPVAAYTGQQATCPPSPDPCAPSGQKACCVTMGPYNSVHMAGCYNPATEICCVGANGSPPPMDRMSWVCPKGGSCPGAFNPNARCSRPCEENDEKCGTACCKPGQRCVSPNRNLCCDAGDNVCAIPGKGSALCCKPGTKCCFNATTANCCATSQTCVNGICKCGAGLKQCGSTCCKTTEMCVGGKCCPKSQMDCAGTCCDKGRCCATAGGGKCCDKGEFCANIAGAPGNKNCCPTERSVVRPAGAPVCCPTGTVDNGDGSCCPPGNLKCCGGANAPSCTKGSQICVSGGCVAV